MKQIIIASIIVGIISLISIGVVIASVNTPYNGFHTPCPNCPADGSGTLEGGVLQEYMSTALANALGMDVDDFTARREAGETLYDFAAEAGINADALAGIRNQARTEALDLAYADGVLTDVQYQYMLQRLGSGFGMGFGSSQGGQQGGNGRGYGQRGSGMGSMDGTQNLNCQNTMLIP